MKIDVTRLRTTIRPYGLVFAGMLFGYGLTADAQPKGDPLASVLATVHTRLAANYVEPLSDEKLQSALLKGLIGSLDPHSEYLTPQELAEQRQHLAGTYAGIGMSFGLKTSCVAKVFPESPAAQVGIQPADCVAAIEGKPTKDWAIDEIVEQFRGAPGTAIKVQMRRAGQLLDFVVERKEIQAPSVESETITMGSRSALLIKIDGFYENTVAEVGHALTAGLGLSNPAAILLDLRDNAGGLLGASVGVASFFLPAEIPVVSMRGNNTKGASEKKTYRATAADWTVTGACDQSDWVGHLRRTFPQLATLPVFVLTNQHTASAAEVVAAALQDHGRARIVGGQTFGKGSVQSFISLGQLGAMKLTTARYYTPKDRSIQAVGVTPDVPVADLQPARREADLPNHLKNEAGAEFGRKQALAQLQQTAQAVQSKSAPATHSVDAYINAALAGLVTNDDSK
jgi:carboxyl-terminal processing protease